LAVASNESWLASAGHGGEVRIWDPATGATRHTLTGHSSGVLALVIAPDGSWLASADKRGEVWIWDSATGATRRTLTGHTSGVSALVVAPDGSWLASASGDTFGGGQVRIWNPTTGTPLTSLRVAGGLSHLLLASTTIVAAGEYCPYFLALCHGVQSAELRKSRLKDPDASPRAPRQARIWCINDGLIYPGQTAHIAFEMIASPGIFRFTGDDTRNQPLAHPVNLRVLLQAEHATVRPMTQVVTLDVDRTSQPILFEVAPTAPGPVELVFRVYLARDSQLLQEIRAELPVTSHEREVAGQ
jgi:hypothetical protein